MSVPVDSPLDATHALARAAESIARRVARGGRLWVVAPGLEDHGRHVAVEFVHPASVGARAVPATAVGGSTPLGDLRGHCRAGDVVISLGDAESRFVSELSVRTLAWGASHLHVGWSTALPVAGLDPRTMFVRLGDGPFAERSLTRAYHLLWELTFLCAQSGTVRHVSPDGSSEAERSCAVCSDEAVIGEVEQLLAADMARVRTECGRVDVDVSLVDPLCTYDLVLIHAGTAIRRLAIEATA